MLRNYIKIAWRNLVKGKLYSVINICGLAVGIACCLLIGFYIHQELSYDRFHEKADRIYRVNHSIPGESSLSTYAQTPKPLAPFLSENFPEVERAVRVQKEDGIVRIEDQLFREKFLVAEQGFLDVFSFKLIKGNKETVFTEREQILLAESTAQKIYGSRDVIGRPLELRIDGDYYQASVGGILEDPPEYSSISFEVIIPLEYWKKVDGSYSRGNNWGSLRPATYVLLDERSNTEALTDKVRSTLANKVSKHFNGTRTFEFQPLLNIHLDSSVEGGLEPTANVNFIYISIIIAALILIIACINFMSISIGHSARRAREVGMRKAMGAHRSQVMNQFWGETFLVVLFSLVLGLLLSELLLPYFNMLIGKSLVLDWVQQPMLLVIVFGTVIVTGLLAGSYPAIYLSKFQPSQVFRNKIYVEGNHFLVRSLSGIQFALAVTLIIGTLFMNQQMDLLLNKSLGFDKELVVQVEVPFEEGKEIVNDLQSALASEALVRHITGSWERMGVDGVSFQSDEIESGVKKITGYTYGAGHSLPGVLGLEIVKGRSFRDDGGAGDNKEVLVNQKLLDAFGWENPIGRKISRRFTFDNAEIVGVVSNFNFQSLHHPVGPLVIHPMQYYTMAYIRLGAGQTNDALDHVEKAWNKIAPGLPFNYTFLDQTIEQQYKSENMWAKLVQLASIIAMILACMGLFGMALLASSKRAKEISIPKVLGATAAGMTVLLSKDFLKPVIVSLVIAIPSSYILMSQWLQGFAYKIEMGVAIYLIAVIATIGISMLTISWQSIRAALANPADSLRSE